LRRAAAAVLACGAVALATSAGASAATGFRAQSYAGFGAESAGGAITGQKPESKLWYANGSWWATMLSPTTGGGHDVYQLTSSGWLDTGVLVDAEAATKEDVLWDGVHLYVLSRTPSSSEPNRLRRFSWSGGAWQLDAGFPVNVPGGGAEAVTIAEDTTGTLWLTYTARKSTYVAHSTGADTSWGTAAKLPFTQAQTNKGDDISSVIAFTDATGPAIGVFWSNQAAQTDYFAVHRDGDPDTAWTLETALSGPLAADDHMNLKTFEGRIYAAVKTSTTTGSSPLIELLVRSPTGQWSANPVATYAEQNTRPIVLVDTAARALYVFMSQGVSNAHGIVYRRSPLDAISFSGPETTLIDGSTINDATSTKQNVDATSGIVVLASDGSSYWWNDLGGGPGGGGPGGDAPPTAFPSSVATSTDTAVPVALSGSDPETCELDFAIVQPPAHGSLGPLTAQTCAAGTPNTDAAAVVYTPAAGYSGPDAFSYRVTDGAGQVAVATITIAVGGAAPPPGTALAPTTLKVTSGALTDGELGSLASADGDTLQIASSTGASPKAGWYVLFSGLPASPGGLTLSIAGGASAPCRQKIEIRNWVAGSWDSVDDRVVSADGTITATVSGTLSNYVSGGQAKVQVVCGASNPFSTDTDAFTLTIG